MSSPAVTVSTTTPASEVLRIFDRGVISAVPVVDSEGHIAGVVSTADVVRRLPGRLDGSLPASDIMSSPPIVATPGEDLELVAWRLVAARAHRLVVIEDERPVGVLSVHDILGGLLHRPVSTPLRSIMTSGITSVLLGDTIEDAIARLATSGVHALIILDGLAPVGIFGQSEAIAARRFPPDLLKDPVEELMCHDLVTLDGRTTIQRAARCLWSTNARRILVTHHEQLAGIVSELDLVDALARTAEPGSPV